MKEPNEALPQTNPPSSKVDALDSTVPVGEDGDSPDVRYLWIVNHLRYLFRTMKMDKLEKFLKQESTMHSILDFLNTNDIRLLLFQESGGTLAVYTSAKLPSAATKRTQKKSLRQLYFAKLNKAPITSAGYRREILVGDMSLSIDSLQHLLRMLQEVLMPLIHNPRNQETWPDMVTKDVTTNLHSFLANVQIMVGQTQGQTCLPLPADVNSTSHASLDPTSWTAKDRIHVLEGCIITWTKQIKNILRQDPEAILNNTVGAGSSILTCEKHPGPMAELNFWKFKAQNLNSIFDQLQSDSIRKVLHFLDQSKSTYNLPFAKLCKEVFQARDEANDNVRYLSPLQNWLEELEVSTEFTTISKLFQPIFHCILLIWKHSQFYNTPGRLVVLIREICNEVIRQSWKYLNGRMMFEMVHNEETTKVVEMLGDMLRLCAHLKTVYFDYKAKGNAECPENSWRIQNNALFVRLDAFLERCHDLLELSQTILQFHKLAKIEIGGTKGKTLTTSVHQIHLDFVDAIQAIENVSYDIMDLDARGFDDDFYEFRTKMKELERRLASVVTQAFDDCNAVTGRFKLLDSFDEILERSIIKTELEKKHAALIQEYSDDIILVQQIFLDFRSSPPIAHNLPPFAGALSWCRGLRERIELPMEKLKNLNRLVLEREDSKEAIKTYTSLIGNLTEYEHELIQTWASTIEQSTQAKLKLPLLRQDTTSSLLFVNFDPALVKLLREVKYFCLLGLEIPDTAMAIYRKAEIFRRQTGNLDLIVNMYNGIQTKLLPVERPLVKSHLDRIDQVLMRGLRQLSWKSHGIDSFLKESMSDVNEANAILVTMKTHSQRIEKLLVEWSQIPIFERRGKPMSIAEFEDSQTSLRTNMYNTVAEGGEEIHKLLKDTLKRLKISQGSPDWRAYVEFINNIIVNGLANVIILSLTYLHEQIDQASIERDDLAPFIEIELDLYGKEVVYLPDIKQTSDQKGLRDVVMSWIDVIFQIANTFQRLDGQEGTYVKEMHENPEIQKIVEKINQSLNENEEQCLEYRSRFISYEYLWTTDLSHMFNQFLAQAWKNDSIQDTQSEDMDVLLTKEDESKQEREVGDLDLEAFDKKIQQYLNLQAEISESKHTMDILFLRINSQPIKQALSTWVTKWIYMFTQYLHDTVVDTLIELNEFMTVINTGLNHEVSSRDMDSLMKCMTHIRDVRKSMDHRQRAFDPLKQVVALLKSHGISVETSYIGSENAFEFLEQAPMRWENTVNKTFKTKEIIQPLQNQTVENIRGDLTNFQTKVTNFRQEFVCNAPFQRRVSLKSKPTRGGASSEGSEEAAAELQMLLEEAYHLLDTFDLKLRGVEKEAKEFNELEELFELNLSKYDLLTTSRKELMLLKQCWDMTSMVEFTFAEWQLTLWNDIDTEYLLDEVNRLHVQIKKLPHLMRSWDLYTRLQESASNMATILPLVHSLHNSAVRERHWKSLMSITRKHFEKGPTFSLLDVVKLELHLHVEEVNEVVEMATKEQKIEARLKQIEELWTGLKFELVQYKTADLFILKPPDVIVEALEEHQMQLQSMAGMGKFVEYFREKVLYWQQALGNVETVLKLWIAVQKQWSSLESIFLCSVDIRTQLPEDTKRFELIDTDVREIYRHVKQSSAIVLEACSYENREHMLRDISKELEKCQKALNEYLDMKKNIFPRFYFVSNVSLLDILSNGNNPPKIMPHLGDCFDGIKFLGFQKPTAAVLATPDYIPTIAVSVTAKDGEQVPLVEPFHMTGAVELWLKKLVFWMQATLKYKLEEALDTASLWEVEKPRNVWLFDYPAQLALLASQILWTEESEAALEEIENGQEDAMKKYIEVCNERLNALIKLALTELTGNDRVKVITLITVDVHARDLVQTLIDKKVESALDFTWQSQLRYYWDNSQLNAAEKEENAAAAGTSSGDLSDSKIDPATGSTRDQKKRNVQIRVCDFRALYSYEYIGNSGRLVITPLTDRCYVTLTTALRLFLGGAPAGPAGTGKTETTKDLARGMGLQCYVFNCSDQMNYQTMADIFKGLAQTGAWGCFDEFNRIPIEVLSVVATQVKTLLDAIVHLALPMNRDEEYQHLPAGTPPVKVGEFDFFGESIALVPTCGFFITMNPGYAGRTELPENLKALFRSCAMIRPDLQPICENMLMAEGFMKARVLSVKFVTLYELCGELLSKQAHYDWGLRAVKSVLRVAGSLKRAEPSVDEEAILMRALRDFNTPKIPLQDLPIFLGLINDLFPSLRLETKVNHDLKQKCIKVCEIRSIQAEDTFISKVIQYQEILDVRHSVMLLGPAGCGKTTIWQTLADCHNLSGTSEQNKDGDVKHFLSKPLTVHETVNPKAVTSDELYGYMTLSKDWKDGVLSILMRNISKEYSPYSAHQTGKWVVLDGDIDAIWIESMNTVMDDNKVLTLVSNERIPLTAAMRMIFEINSLMNATPATVSRAGILYINETDIGWQPFVESWVHSRSASEKEFVNLPKLFDRYVDQLYELVHANKLQYVVPISKMSIISTLCRLLEAALTPIPENRKTIDVLEKVFAFAAIWAFGGALSNEKNNDYKKQFSTLWHAQFKGSASSGEGQAAASGATAGGPGASKSSGAAGPTASMLPESGTIFDYYFNAETNEILPWNDAVPEFSPLGELSFNSIVVATSESVRMMHLLDQIVATLRQPLLLVGAAGTGKTTLIRDFLHNLDENMTTACINMNYFTDSKALQVQLEQYVDKRSGKIFGPLNNKHLVYFIDDLNMPFVEEYGTQTPIALIRQYMDYRSWYDRHDLGSKKILQDVQFIAAMNHKSGSFRINNRLQRHFSTFCVTMPSKVDLKCIYQSVLEIHWSMFVDPIKNLTPTIVAATIELYHEICNEFLPSAVKFHYLFNMRDLGNIFQGMLLSKSEYYMHPTKIIRLWLHECQRVFSDRLISQSEIGRYQELIIEQSKKHFEEHSQEHLHEQPLIFTNFITPTIDDCLVYLPLTEKAELKRVLQTKLQQYNESNPVMGLVLFDQAMEHVTRIVRILANPRGNALLIGVGGSGKQSLSKLAAFICSYQVIQINITSHYSIAEFKENLKDLYRKAGVRPGIPLVFLLTDSQIVDERFLVFINDILSSGYIADLFTADEYEIILNSLKNEAKSCGIPDSREHMLEFFIDRVRMNLHLILAFSPVGDVFRTRARRFPGLINCTSIDWFHPWPKDALVNVAHMFLQDIDLRTPAIQENVCHHMADVHISVKEASVQYRRAQSRHNYVTPRSFLELIQFYKSLLDRKRELQMKLIERLDVGLRTLEKTAKDVEHLQHDLKQTLDKVEEKKKATDELLEQMGNQRSEAEAKQAVADIERGKAEEAANNARKLENEAQGELMIAKPALDASKEAVNCLSKASLTELKSMSKPPAGVDKVTTAVLMMVKGETRNFSWDNAKKMMAKVDAFKTTLENYKGETIPADVVARVEPIIDDPNFTFEKMKSKSVAAANLCSWVINIVTFHKIYVKVKPLMDALDEAQQVKNDAEKELAAVEAVVAEVENQLAALQASFREATNEKAKVEAEAQACQERLSLAERLVNGLASENERWGREIDTLRQKEVTLVGDVLLSAAFVSYVGAFDMSFREYLWKETWVADLRNREIPTTDEVDPLQILANDSNIAQWMNEGLPADRISIENGCIITSCQRWPLMIDPQLQGIKWLRTRLTPPEVDGERAEGSPRQKKLIVLQTSQAHWMKQLENAITEGDAVIIENLGETFDATLDPLLGRAIYRKGRNMFLRLGGNEVVYDEGFQLFLQTKLINPHYKPEIAAQCTLINFIVTEKGLEDQLLADVVNREQPELEKEKQSLQQAFNQYKIQLLELENQLLERLANAPEDILSDVPLIEGLEKTKQTANEINVAVEKGKETELIINEAREVYRPVATEGSMLYFMMVQLCGINHMYQYSLDAFTVSFFKAMAKTGAVTTKEEDEDKDEASGSSTLSGPALAERVEALRESLRFTIFTMVSRGLFEDHKLIFLTQLTFNLMKYQIIGNESGYEHDYMQFLLRGPKLMSADENTIPWLNDSQWQSLQALVGLSGFERFISDLEESEARFKEWYNTSHPESEKLPLDWRELDKTPFLKLLVIRCLRPDRLTIAITNFIRTTLPFGLKYTTCDSDLNSFQVLERTFEDSTPCTPIYFVLSPGTDVVADVDKLAIKFNMIKGKDYHNIALGQGQDVVAMQRLLQGHQHGHWVILNNVHLMPVWLTALEKQLDEFAADKSHQNFRVFISSDPSPSIPIGILDRSIKLTNEPPSGLKANLRRAFLTFSQTEFEEFELRTRSIVFGMCYFHAIMLERKKFGPQGFNMMYPFAIGDLVSSCVVLRNYMENAPSKVPWQDLRYLFGEIMYGGHIVNDFDRLVCNTYLEYFLRDDLLDELQMYPYVSTGSSSAGDGGSSHEASFIAPKSSSNFERILEHIELEMKGDTPLAFGLHPNAEIAFRTEMGESLFKTIIDLQPRDVSGGESSDSLQMVAEELLQDILENYRELRFGVEDIDCPEEERGPFQNVFIQECQRMNKLLDHMTASLIELDLGFRGDLTMTEGMDRLTEALYMDRIPATWMKFAYPSLRSLGPWLQDLQLRIAQLQEWTANPIEIPRVTWISGLFNPQSFLTAIMQNTSQKNGMELDKLVIVTDVTKRTFDSIDAPSRDGQFIHGLSLEGARWDEAASVIVSSLPKEMYCPMPVINCRAVLADRKEQSNIFDCPVYKTQQRGPTYVFTAQLRTKAPAAKWILAGAVLVMDVV